MIITQTPLRIPIGGGGTDIPSYYKRERGHWISAAINKYIYITLNNTMSDEFIIRYSQIERTAKIDEIKHPLIREIFKLIKARPGLEMSSIADIPSGTGMGSSGSFGVGLIRALQAHNRNHYDPSEVAEMACHVEMNILKEPSGKQDQYAATYGGITEYECDKDGKVTARPLALSPSTLIDLEENLLLFFTGYTRKAGDILKKQDDATKANDNDMIENLNKTKALGLEIKDALVSGNCVHFGELMDTHWQNKKKRGKMSNPDIDKWYNLALANGAVGGKVIGAGGGGFLMFYAKDRHTLRQAMQKEGLHEIRFGFDFEGSRVLLNLG
ncbi:MAG: galactokinase [Nanoarchaeota archaeon]